MRKKAIKKIKNTIKTAVAFFILFDLPILLAAADWIWIN
jgi:hypothetical protein